MKIRLILNYFSNDAYSPYSLMNFFGDWEKMSKYDFFLNGKMGRVISRKLMSQEGNELDRQSSFRHHNVTGWIYCWKG